MRAYWKCPKCGGNNSIKVKNPDELFFETQDACHGCGDSVPLRVSTYPRVDIIGEPIASISELNKAEGRIQDAIDGALWELEKFNAEIRGMK